LGFAPALVDSLPLAIPGRTRRDTLERMYGGNVEKLCKIRAEVDPDDVMGLTGVGDFKIDLRSC